MLKRLAFSAFSLLTVTTFGQPTKAWVRSINRTIMSDLQMVGCKLDAAGNTYTASLVQQHGPASQYGYFEIDKFSSAGTLLWKKRFVGQGSGLGTISDFELDKSGNPIVAYSDFLSSLTGNGPVVTKINASTGTTIWEVVTPTINGQLNASVGVDSSNNVFVGGTNYSVTPSRFQVIKLNGASGATLWNKAVVRNAPTFSDLLTELKVDAQSNVSLVGLTALHLFCNDPYSVVIAKVRGSDGATLWSTTYMKNASLLHYPPRVDTDAGSNVYFSTYVDSSGGLAVVGKRNGSTGAALWTKEVASIGASAPDDIDDIVVDAGGGVVAQFSVESFGPETGILSYNSSGGLRFSKKLALWAGQASLIGYRFTHLVAQGTNVFSYGYQFGSSPTAIVSKLNASGVTVWNRGVATGPFPRTFPADIAVNSTGDPMASFSKETDSFNRPQILPGVARLANTTGVFVFSKIGSNSTINTVDMGTGIVADTNGNTYCVGSSGDRILALKFNPSGTQLWLNEFDDLSNDTRSLSQPIHPLIAKDGSNNIFVGGSSRRRYFVRKLGGTTGGEIWRKLYNYQGFTSMTTDPSGAVIMAEQDLGRVIKIDGAGVEKWNTSVVGSLSLAYGMRVTTNSLGEVFVAGYTTGPFACPGPTTEKLLVAKLNGTTGALIWKKEFVGLSPGYNRPSGIGLDGGGNVLVGATSQGTNNVDYLGLKLFNTNGGTIWSSRQNNANKNDISSDCLVDGAGNLVITGVSGNDGWTVKFQGSNGVKSWGNVLTVPAGQKFVGDVERDVTNNIYVSGLSVVGGASSYIAQKVNVANGLTVWVSSTAGGLFVGSLPRHAVVNSKLHLLSTTPGTSFSVANMSLTQFNP